jgi:hypothetical protein
MSWVPGLSELAAGWPDLVERWCPLVGLTETPKPGPVTLDDSVDSPSEQKLDAAGRPRDDLAQRVSGKTIRWVPRLLPPLIYLLAAMYLYSRFLAHPNSGVPGGPDGVIYVWYFEWERQAVLHLHNPLFSPAMNAPFGVNVMWNGSLLLLAIVCIPLTVAFGPFAAAGLMMMLSPVVSASTAYFVFRRITGNAWASALAASLYGFGPFFVGQNGHLHLLFAPFPPLLLWIGYELFIRQKWRPSRLGVLLGITAGFGVLATQEIVALSLVVTCFAVLVLALVNWRTVPAKARYTIVGLLTGSMVALIVLIVPIGYMFFGPQHLPGGVVPNPSRIDVAGLVRPNSAMHYASSADVLANRHFPAGSSENTGYLGWALLAVVVLSCLWLVIRRDRFVLWWLPTAVFTLLLSFGNPIQVNGKRIANGPWDFVGSLPLIKGAIATRFSLLTTLLVAFMLAWGLSRLGGRKLFAGLVVVALALVPLRPNGRYGFIERYQTPRFFTSDQISAIAPGSTALLLPLASTPYGEAPVMSWQIRAHLRFNLIGGYSVFRNGSHMSYVAGTPAFARLLIETGKTGELPTPATIAAALPSIARSGTRYIVITDQQPRPALVARLTEQITGCVIHRVSDVDLCAIPTTAP